MALSMGYSLAQEQRMKLVMTPELRQAIHVLQLSAIDLNQYIQEQALENPVLEVEEVTIDEPFQVNEERLADWTAYLGSGEREYRAGFSVGAGDDSPFEKMVASEDSLVDNLEIQLRCLSLNKMEFQICQFIIGCIDEDGYLDIDPSILCKRFTISEQELEDILTIIHGLDPAGIGARSLSECLAIQLRREIESDHRALGVVTEAFLPFAEGRWREVARRLDCSLAEVQNAADRIRRLNPRPGTHFNREEASRYIHPDVFVAKRDGEWEITVNEIDMPRLSISSYYTKVLHIKDGQEKQVASYIKDRLQSAMGILKSIEQRRHTMYRVTEKILAEQQDFFVHGVAYLKPLTLSRLADLLDVHESTVSRATQHKYMQTPQGMFPFRYFFPSGVMTDQGEYTSAQSVKDKIGQMITKEQKKKPLSDQRIADLLETEGINISRRTVTKYREEMGIGTSRKRRRYERESLG
ncbi:RNA polymerase, sigma 54 subunit, RpoN/SigL [Marininema mesophilum]|uniref:RNA polymerase, sigma 54 subunit, RpoN/SigL n=1 Tax=Marininema mesophilum TaxID=1048340 RepID=A0A1H2TRS3_9BACL|nr:RNA polymerase factor sigma-54 [Marininema mesophilum]SDW46535.1 RNA polymerase, sigma 54 subunit, RpoN/SigL [Marininema mesophilum]